jgi:hypothetical protein
MKNLIIITAIALIALAGAPASFAGAGFGLTVGRDWSLDMSNTEGVGERAALDSALVSLDGISVILQGDQTPLFVSRRNWRQSLVSLGLRAFIDGFPGIHRYQLSANFSAWEYDGAILFPSAFAPGVSPQQILANPGNPDLYVLEREEISLEASDRRLFGIDATPYARLQFDLTAARYLFRDIPFIDWYAGAGLSLHFATPALSDEVAAKALEEQLAQSPDLSTLRQRITENINDIIIDELLDRLSNPGVGAHITSSVTVRPPRIPAGVFVEVLFQFPLKRTNPDIDMREYGFTLNTGFEVQFGKR